MHNPFISPKLKIRLKDGAYRVFTTSTINIGEEVEACPFIPITKKAIGSLEKNGCFDLLSSFFVNPEEVAKEHKVLDHIKNILFEAQASGANEDQLRSIIYQQSALNPVDSYKVGAILTGFGSMYSRTEEPNVNWSYQPDEKLFLFTAIRTILAGEELAIPKI